MQKMGHETEFNVNIQLNLKIALLVKVQVM